MEWKIIELAHKALGVSVVFYIFLYSCRHQTLANVRGELSAEKHPTIQKVYPLLEKLQHEWEVLLDDAEYSLVHDALEAGLKNMKKWFRAAGQSGIYFIAHSMYFLLLLEFKLKTCMPIVLDPTIKLRFLSVMWDPKLIETHLKKMKKTVSAYFFF